MDILVPAIIIIVANFIGDYICNKTQLINSIKEKVNIKKSYIDVISFSFVFIMVCIYYFFSKYCSINTMLIQSIQLFIIVTIFNIGNNLKLEE